MPNFVETPTFTFVNGDFLYIEVYSPNLDTILYYKVKVTVVDDAPVLYDILLAGRSATGYSSSNTTVQQFGTGLGTPAATYGAALAGEVWFGASQLSTPLTVIATPMLPKSTSLEYAVAVDGAEPIFSSTPTVDTNGDKTIDSNDSFTVTVADGSYLYVKSTLAATSTTAAASYVYKLKLVQKKDDRTLTAVTIRGASDASATTMDIGDMGTVSFPGSEYYGSYLNGAVLATKGNNGTYSTTDKTHGLDSITIQATATDPTLKIEYDVADPTALRDYLVFAHEPRTDNTTGLFTNLTSGQYLAIQVTSEIGEKGWYRFRVAAGQSGAALTSASVGATSATIGSTLTTFYGYWLQGTTGSVTLATPTAPVTATVTKDASSDEATVEYGVAGSSYGLSLIPSTWNTTGVLAASDIIAGNYIVFRVTSGNGLNQTYYALKITIQ
jgi:hypothetical protein